MEAQTRNIDLRDDAQVRESAQFRVERGTASALQCGADPSPLLRRCPGGRARWELTDLRRSASPRKSYGEHSVSIAGRLFSRSAGPVDWTA